MKQSFAQVCCNLISNIFSKNNIQHKSKNNRIFVRSANKKMLIDFNDMTLTFDDEENPRFRMKKFAKVTYNNMMEMRRRYENKLTELAKYVLKDNKIDLRKNATHDIGNRDEALLYINGKFYENSAHADCLQQYLDEGDDYIDVETYYRNREFKKYTTDKDVIAFAHKATEYKNLEDFQNDVKTTVIFLETNTLQNITRDEAAKLFNEHYNLPVYDDDSADDEFIEDYRELVATRKDLRKNAEHDNYNREYAILYVDGKVLTGETHSECMNEYLNEKGLSLNDTYNRYQTVYRPEMITDDLRKSVEEDNDEEMQDMLNVYDAVEKYAFAHYDDNCVFIEEFSLYNCSLEEVVNAIKKEPMFENCEFYNDDKRDDNSNTGYEKIAKRKDFRKTSSHDSYNRVEAILYINGEFITANTHAEALNIYNDEHEINEHVDSSKRREVSEKVNAQDVIAFAHKVRDRKYELSNKENDFIFLETKSLQNISKEEAAQLFKQQFNLEVYDDDSNKNDEAYPSEYTKLASIKDLRKNKFRIQPRR